MRFQQHCVTRIIRPPRAGLALLLIAGMLAVAMQQDACASDETHQKILAGLDALYQGRFQKAEAVFSLLMQQEPANPKGYFFLALTYRWLTRIDPTSTAYQRRFEQAMKQAIAVAHSQYEEHEDDVDAMLYLAAAYGYRAEYYQFLKHDWNNAYNDGSKMREYLEEAEDFPRTTIDVELGYGLYNYYAYLYRDKIGWWRFLLSLPKGDKDKGINLLETVRKRGEYSRVEAWYFLIEIYKDEDVTHFELTPESFETLRSIKNLMIPDKLLHQLKALEHQEFPDESTFWKAVTQHVMAQAVSPYKGFIVKAAKQNRAVVLSRELHRTYPDNPFFHTLLAGIYHQYHDWEHSRRTAWEILSRAGENPYYSDYLIYQAKYLIGESSFFKGEYDEALQQFDDIIAFHPHKPSYLLPWSHLRRGTIYNVQGEEAKAAQEYKLVLTLDDIHHVHDVAEGLLKNQQKAARQ